MSLDNEAFNNQELAVRGDLALNDAPKTMSLIGGTR